MKLIKITVRTEIWETPGNAIPPTTQGCTLLYEHETEHSAELPELADREGKTSDEFSNFAELIYQLRHGAGADAVKEGAGVAMKVASGGAAVLGSDGEIKSLGDTKEGAWLNRPAT
jgi:hypothetical protein